MVSKHPKAHCIHPTHSRCAAITIRRINVLCECEVGEIANITPLSSGKTVKRTHTHHVNEREWCPLTNMRCHHHALV